MRGRRYMKLCSRCGMNLHRLSMAAGSPLSVHCAVHNQLSCTAGAALTWPQEAQQQALILSVKFAVPNGLVLLSRQCSPAASCSCQWQEVWGRMRLSSSHTHTRTRTHTLLGGYQCEHTTRSSFIRSFFRCTWQQQGLLSTGQGPQLPPSSWMHTNIGNTARSLLFPCPELATHKPRRHGEAAPWMCSQGSIILGPALYAMCYANTHTHLGTQGV
jgi:hypothetical protein